MARGDLAPGAALPSVRRLASGVGLSPGTVAAALGELRRRGVVCTEPRRGTRIGESPPVGSVRRALPVPAGARDLSTGNPDPALLPDVGDVAARIRLQAHLYSGEPALATLLDRARAQLVADGIPAAPMCVTSGALDAIERVLGAQLRPGDRVAVENPGYAALFDLLRAQSLGLEPVAVDDRGMRPDELRAALVRGARAAVITPRGQNPTGAALDRERARELREVLAGHPHVLVVEDDHLGAAATGELHTTVTGARRWAVTRSVAKALGPDLRVAVLAGDAHTIARVEGRQQCGPGWVSHILQTLVLNMWADERTQAGVRAAAAAYSERRVGLLGALERHRVRAHGASGLNVWVPVEDEGAVVAGLMQRGWVVAPGAPYRLLDAQPAVRVTTATLTREEATRLAGDLAELLAPVGFTRSG